MSSGVWIAGAGVISAIGNNLGECLNAFKTGRSGIGPITFLDTIHRNSIPVAEVKLSNAELANLSGLSSGLSRTALLSVIAAREAMGSAEIENLHSFRTGFISANSVGGMDKTEFFFREFHADHHKGRLRDVVHHECGAVTDLVAEKLGIRHYVSTVSTACSSSANSILCAARMIRNNLLDIVIAGGTDSLTQFTLNGFNTLMILDSEPCKPFDENRNGLNLGEGAAYLVLVSERVAEAVRSPLYGRLSGSSNASDAYHQTASSPEGKGSFLAMQGALKQSGLNPSDIDYINLHGTGTQNNDSSEGTAISRLFGSKFPMMSSTKSFTGHTLGASGGMEAVFSAMSVQKGIIFPNLRFRTPMKELNIIPEVSYREVGKLNHAMSNSFGFGGNCTSLVFSKL